MRPRSDTARFAARLLVLCVVAGLLLPRMGAALADAAGFRAAVICRGDSIAILHVGSDGVPVETELSDHGPCAVPDLVRGRAAVAPVWHRLVPAERPAMRAGATPRAARWHGPPPKRGPPRPV
ncbi:hypothetical protein [uncultured Jannaschia sp.]|uniref:hypothetical protein n=1 Tax=uncultured Jannaschia sp. TaxID=293347 RepID=UPI00262B559E|nr:hypothetical protein [uncultured Jannaschia sp.]